MNPENPFDLEWELCVLDKRERTAPVRACGEINQQFLFVVYVIHSL